MHLLCLLVWSLTSTSWSFQTTVPGVTGPRRRVMRMPAELDTLYRTSKEGVLDLVDTVVDTVEYEKESKGLSTECNRAWRLAWWTFGGVIAVTTVATMKFPSQGSYVIAKDFVVRSLAGISAIAFGVALKQNPALLGRDGLNPNWKTLFRVPHRTWFEKLTTLPTLGWLAATVDPNTGETVNVDAAKFDRILQLSAVLGLTCATGLFTLGGAGGFLSGLLCLGIYVAQLSISCVGAPFYGYGWESQLAETSILVAAWLLNLLPGVAAMRWLCFKIMLGAGLIKMRASSRRPHDCWKNLTAMTLFFETQPMPGPLSRRLHFLPRPVHLYATASNHVIELAAPFLLCLGLLPFGAAFVRSYGLIHLGFHLTLLFSGNLSFLNYLTMIPALACFDDVFWRTLLLAPQRQNLGGALPSMSLLKPVIHALGLSFFFWLNAPVYRNLFTPSSTRLERPPRQAMNAAFDRLVSTPFGTANLRNFRLANTYGAFGSVTNSRDELIISGSRGEPDNWEWSEFEFHGPSCRQIAPWHLRLDWQKWISTIPGRDATSERWFVALLLKLLQQDPATTRLLKTNPFTPGDPPTHIRIQLFRYKFAKFDDDENSSGGPWSRTLRSTVLSPIGRNDLSEAVHRFDTATFWPGRR